MNKHLRREDNKREEPLDFMLICAENMLNALKFELTPEIQR